MSHKNELIECFQDTLNICFNGILQEATEKAIHSNKVYIEGFTAKKQNKKLNADIIVESNTSFNAAKAYLQYGKVAVLNFANPHNPGGGIQNGAMAQEECLCRSSNLYLCISNDNVYNDYYLYNKNIGHHFFSDRLIYTKDVTVFKDDSDVPQIMPKKYWFNVDVITCAAPYIAKRKYTNKAALKELFKGRIKNIFESAIDNGVEVIILGAFGCGAFKNPPEVVAKAFREVIDENGYKNNFKKIVFAIKSTVNDDLYMPCPNIMAFEQEFFMISAEANKLRFSDPYPFEQAFGEMKMPSGRILKGGEQFNPYLEWQSKNNYFGKQFSVLGDSISTLAGYNPKDYNVFYDGENCEKSGVKEMKDTWWGKVIDFFGGELLVNNSWSGSRVTKLPNSDKLFPSGCSDERTSSLHINSVKPDVIIIYLGTNDWANDVEDYCIDNILTDELHCKSFDFAYGEMLKKIKANYPNAEIWCCTLNTTFMSSNPSFKFPYTYGGTHIEKYNQIIKDTADMYKCKVIDLYDYHIPYDSIDGSHPNEDGMNTLATMIIRSMGGKEIEQFMDCENNSHEFIVAEQYTGGTKYVCKKCCKTNHLSTLYYDELRDIDKDKSTIEGNDTFLIYDSDAEYVRLPSDITRMLYSDTIKLFDTDKNKELEIQKVQFDIGRSPDCEITIDNSSISRIHASFYYENSTWYIMDRDSKNGTWLNDKKLEQNKKYELYSDDVISFAKVQDYTFYKSKVKEKPKSDIEKELAVLEEACENYAKSDLQDINALKIITIILSRVPMYFPVDIDVEAMFGNIDPSRLKAGDVITSSKDVKIKILTIDVGDEEIIPMFTSAEQAHKGPSVSITRFHPQDYLPVIIPMNKSIIINPFGENPISFKPNYLTEIILPLVQDSLHQNDEKENEKSIEFNIGTIIDDKYELLRQVGQGAFTKTYLVMDKRLNKMWLAKLCAKSNSSKSIIAAMINEANMVKNLNHNAIPRIVDIIDNNEYFCIIEDYIEGETLENIVKNYGAQPAENVVDWAKQLCNALGYLHSLNPPHIYRDLKPANIILKPDGNITIIDFGIMRTYKPNQTNDTCSLGTKGYAAPEQYGGRGQTDARTDIYGLGMTMYHLLTGIDPKDSDFVAKPICQINPDLPKGLEYIIDKCIQIDPKDRYQFCNELFNDLANYQQLPPKKSPFSKLFK